MTNRLKYAMRALLAGLLLAAAVAAPARAQFCPSCIQNTAVPQAAQMNITSATIRGQLTVGSLNVSTFNVTVGTATQFYGGGGNLKNLNASNVTGGTLSTTTVTGQYFGLTGTGALSTGTWNASVIGTQWGGTGQNWVNISTGSIPYFSTTGVMATLLPGPPQSLLQSNGLAAPVWTSSPAVNGSHIFGLPATALLAGTTLPASVIVSSNSIPYVNGASIVGSISVPTSSFTGTIAISQILAGTLPNSIPASSITVTGVTPGTYGDALHSAQIAVGTDGRLTSATNIALQTFVWTSAGNTIYPTNASNNVLVFTTMTIQGSAFSVGGSSFAVNGGHSLFGTSTNLDFAQLSIQPDAGSGGEILFSSVSIPLTWTMKFQDGGRNSYIGSGDALFHAAFNDLAFDAGSTLGGNILFGSDFAEHMRLTAGGNLGIGTTSPDATLQVYGEALTVYNPTGGTSYVQTASSEVALGYYLGGHYAYLEMPAGAGGLHIWNRGTYDVATFSDSGGPSGGTISLLPGGGGNVGIGTTSPATLFNVVGGESLFNSTNHAIRLSSGTALGQEYGRITYGNDAAGDDVAIYGYIGHPLTLSSNNGNPVITITVTPTVQLNTVSSPTGKILCLDSSGNIGHCTSGASCTGTCTCTCTAN